MSQNNGGELQALRFWLIHLDPTSRFHAFYTDSQWVFNLWSGAVSLTPWTPYYSWWLQVLALKSDLGSTVSVYKTKGHQTLGAAVSPDLLWQREGNRLADVAAKSVFLDCAAARAHADRMRRTEWVSTQVLLYFGRLLAWLAQYNLLPLRDVAERKPPRMPTPKHILLQSPCGNQRCLRCFRIGAECVQAPCRLLPRRPHRVHVLGEGLFCARCGAYSFHRTVKLQDGCRGRPANASAAQRLAHLMAGRHPTSGAPLGIPREMCDPAHELYMYLDPPPPP